MVDADFSGNPSSVINANGFDKFPITGRTGISGHYVKIGVTLTTLSS
jgi:hypothetical protein